MIIYKNLRRKLKNPSEGMQNPDDKMFYKYFHIESEKNNRKYSRDGYRNTCKNSRTLIAYSAENRAKNKITYINPDRDKQHPFNFTYNRNMFIKTNVQKCGHIIFYNFSFAK